MSREMVFYGGQCVLDAESEYLSEIEVAQHLSANAEVGWMQAKIDRLRQSRKRLVTAIRARQRLIPVCPDDCDLRAENAELCRQLAAEHDAAMRNDELRKMAERLGAGYEQEYLDDPLSGAVRSENESIQELSDSLRGVAE